jgi:hypothetical protein
MQYNLFALRYELKLKLKFNEQLNSESTTKRDTARRQEEHHGCSSHDRYREVYILFVLTFVIKMYLNISVHMKFSVHTKNTSLLVSIGVFLS